MKLPEDSEPEIDSEFAKLLANAEHILSIKEGEEDPKGILKGKHHHVDKFDLLTAIIKTKDIELATMAIKTIGRKGFDEIIQKVSDALRSWGIQEKPSRYEYIWEDLSLLAKSGQPISNTKRSILAGILATTLNLQQATQGTQDPRGRRNIDSTPLQHGHPII